MTQPFHQENSARWPLCKPWETDFLTGSQSWWPTHPNDEETTWNRKVNPSNDKYRQNFKWIGCTVNIFLAAHFPPACKGEVRWMFQHLDSNGDARLSLQELYDLEHDQSEVCLKPFLQQCDTDHDINVSPTEWCRCFQRTERPCAAVKRKITPELLGKTQFPQQEKKMSKELCILA